VWLAPAAGTWTAADAAATWTGINADDAAGTRLGRALDLDADGRDELLVGAPGDDTWAADAGAVHLLPGALLP
jgi:hypothetical protein